MPIHSARRRRLLLALVLGAAAVAFSPQRRRVYLTRRSLVPPTQSAMARVLRTKDDMAFIAAFGFDVDTFRDLLSRFRTHLPAPPRHPRRPRLLTPELHLALVLSYLTTPQRQKSIALLFGITPSVVSRAIWVGLGAMKTMMSKDKDTWAIRWPTPETMGDMAAAVRAREPLLKHVFGFVDGLNLRIYQPGDVDEQNAYYNGWLGDTYCSQVIVFLANGEIAWASFNNPGSWHDAKIANGLYDILSNPERTPAPFALLADCAFPTNQEVSGKILSKPKENVAAKEQDGNTHRLWEAIIRQRQAAEWGMRALQGAFGRLDLRLPVHKAKRALILSVIFQLHNWRARHVGLNQIKEVYFPQWQLRRS